MSVEPNDVIANASDSGVSSSETRSTVINARIDPKEDIDLYKFQADEGLEITLDVDSSDELFSGFDPILRLFDSKGNELSVSDDDSAPGEEDLTLDPYIAFNSDFTGDYYVGVGSVPESDPDSESPEDINDSDLSGGSIGNYNLEISLVDVIEGTEREDTLLGDSRNNLIKGLGGNDVLVGVKQNDNLIGGDGKDSLFGSNGDDTLIGNSGSDALVGGSGADVLQGDGGNDVLSGGEGEDIFILDKTNQGSDIVSDFEDGSDKISLQNVPSFSSLTIEHADHGFGTSISESGNTIATVTGVEPSIFSEDDFDNSILSIAE